MSLEKQIANGKRGPTNHRLGEWHGRAKYPADMVRTARMLRDGGSTYKEIGQSLGVPWRTVADWVSYATRYAD